MARCKKTFLVCSLIKGATGAVAFTLMTGWCCAKMLSGINNPVKKTY
jgi:hypothetical protein